MSDVVIVDGVRTPIGTLGGALSSVRADDLAAHVLRALIERTGLSPRQVDEVILGCANQAGEDNRNVARMAALLADFPHSVAGMTVNRLCASGLDAIISAARTIQCGEAEIVIAGGVEQMTRAPYVLGKSERPFDRSLQLFDTSLGWRFPNPQLAARFPLEAMGETAENIAEQTGISRERQDAFALTSHTRAVAAINAGHFRAEIAPITLHPPRGEPHMVDTDEHPRMTWVADRYEVSTTAERLARLKPAFREAGSVTAGNSSGLNDGAAALLLMSAAQATALGQRPLVRILGSAVAGVDPRVMGLGPIPAVRKLLARTGLRVADLDLIELNEAFAVQALAVIDELALPPERVNVNGGAIALGHPLGCSGARLMTTLIHEMQRRQRTGVASSPYGLVTLCVGVGQGVATLVEWVGDRQS